MPTDHEQLSLKPTIPDCFLKSSYSYLPIRLIEKYAILLCDGLKS